MAWVRWWVSWRRANTESVHHPATNLEQVVAASKRLVRRLLSISENRLELLAVEVQEGRERLLLAIMLIVGVAALGLLAGIALTLALAVLFWEQSAVAVLFGLAAVYVLGAVYLYWRLHRLRCGWQILPASLEQLRKDRECLDQALN